MIISKIDLYKKFENDIENNLIVQKGKLHSLRKLSKTYDCSYSTIKRVVDHFVRQNKLFTVKGVGIFVCDENTHAVDNYYTNKHIGAIVLDDQVQDELNDLKRKFMNDGWAFSLYNASSDLQSPECEKQFLKLAQQQHFTAIILEASPIAPTNDDLFKKLKLAGTKVIHLAMYKDDMQSESYVIADTYAAGQVCTARLAAKNYRRIFVYSDKAPAPFLNRWYAGILMMANQLDIECIEVVNSLPPEQLIKKLTINDKKTAVVCGNSDLAMNLYTKAHELKYSIPQDFGIISLSPATDENHCISFLHFTYHEMVKEALKYAMNRNLDALDLIQKKYEPIFIDNGSF